MNRRLATQLAADAQRILDADGIDALGTTDPTAAPAALLAGQTVVVVNAPKITWETWNIAQAEWQLWAIAGPERSVDPATGWDSLDRAMTLLCEPLELVDAEPTEFVDAQGHGWPAYILTLTTDHTRS